MDRKRSWPRSRLCSRTVCSSGSGGSRRRRPRSDGWPLRRILPARSTRPNSITCDAPWKFTASAQERTPRLELEESPVHRLDDKLNQLIAIGKGQGGWLTFSQVNDYL